MKRAIVLALAAALAIGLVACSEDDAQPHDDAPPSTSETPPSVIETPPPDPPDNAPVLSGGIILPSGVLPNGEYTPPEQPERYYPDTVQELIPSDSYGRIWPYIGGYVQNQMIGTRDKLVGLCDEAGKIVCDPVYNDVVLIEHNGHKLYALNEYIQLKGSDYRYEDLYITTIAALDGSWAEKFERALWRETSGYELSTRDDFWTYDWRDKLDYDYITAIRDGRWGVIDWDGKLMLPFAYLEPVCFREGLASVLSEDGKTINFIDISGKTVLGPYEAPPRQRDEWSYYGAENPITNKIMFYQGYAKFFDNGKYGIINRDGDVVIPAAYDFITCMNGGVAMTVDYFDRGTGEMTGRLFGAVNDSGAVIVEPGESYGMPYNIDGTVIIWIDEDVREQVAYDGSRAPYEDEYIWPRYENNTVYFGNNRFDIPGYDYVEVLYDEWLVVYRFDSPAWQIFDLAGNPITQKKRGMPDVWRSTSLVRGLLLVEVPDNTYNRYTITTPYMIYDLAGNPVLSDAYYIIVSIEDRFMVCGYDTAGLVDRDNNFIIEVPIIQYNTD